MVVVVIMDQVVVVVVLEDYSNWINNHHLDHIIQLYWWWWWRWVENHGPGYGHRKEGTNGGLLHILELPIVLVVVVVVDYPQTGGDRLVDLVVVDQLVVDLVESGTEGGSNGTIQHCYSNAIWK